MKITTSSSALTAFDGKIILRTVIDKPGEQGSHLLNYLHDYSDKIDAFAREKLLLRLSELYEAAFNNRLRYAAYVYTFKIISTYASEAVDSCLLLVRLYQGNNLLTSNVDSVISVADRFVPPELFTKKRVANSVLVLDSNGHPAWADVTNGRITYSVIKNYNLSI